MSLLKIHCLDRDPRQYSEPEIYKRNYGSMSAVCIGFNEGLKELGCYAEPDDADFVGTCDGLDIKFRYKNKPSFLINVFDVINVLPEFCVNFQRESKQIIFGLSNQNTNLWRSYGIKAETTMPGTDAEFWHQTKPKAEKFTFVFDSFSNIRSGLDMALQAFAIFAAKYPNSRLIVKNAGGSETLHKYFQWVTLSADNSLDITYINDRWPMEKMRDLFSEAHVSLNVMRHASWGLNIQQVACCGAVPIVGDFCPSNEIIEPNLGYKLKPTKEIRISDIAPALEQMGLTNCYGNFPYREAPRFYDYDIDKYAQLMEAIYLDYNQIDRNYRSRIAEHWTWKSSAEVLVNHLKNL